MKTKIALVLAGVALLCIFIPFVLKTLVVIYTIGALATIVLGLVSGHLQENPKEVWYALIWPAILVSLFNIRD